MLCLVHIQPTCALKEFALRTKHKTSFHITLLLLWWRYFYIRFEVEVRSRRRRRWQFRFPYFSIFLFSARFFLSRNTLACRQRHWTTNGDNVRDALYSFGFSFIFLFLPLLLLHLYWYDGTAVVSKSLHYTINNILQCSLMYLWISLSDARHLGKKTF